MCNCVTEINEKLTEAGHNTRIKTPLILTKSLDLRGTKLEIVTEKADRNVRKKPVSVFSTYCPFCGENQ